MKYNHKNLVNNALIQGSRDYMKTGFLKGEASLSTSLLLWRHSPDPDESIYFLTNSNGHAIILPFGTSQKLIYKEYSEGATYIRMTSSEPVPEGWESETASIEVLSSSSFLFTVDGFTTEVQNQPEGLLILSPMSELEYEPRK